MKVMSDQAHTSRSVTTSAWLHGEWVSTGISRWCKWGAAASSGTTAETLAQQAWAHLLLRWSVCSAVSMQREEARRSALVACAEMRLWVAKEMPVAR